MGASPWVLREDLVLPMRPGHPVPKASSLPGSWLSLQWPSGDLCQHACSLNPGREGEVLSKEEVPCAVGLLQAWAPVSSLSPKQGCHPALTVPGGAEHLFHIESRWGGLGGGGGLSVLGFLLRCQWPMASDVPLAGLLLLQFLSFSLILPGRRVMRNQKQDFRTNMAK